MNIAEFKEKAENLSSKAQQLAMRVINNKSLTEEEVEELSTEIDRLRSAQRVRVEGRDYSESELREFISPFEILKSADSLLKTVRKSFRPKQ